jgi:tetratricopeptide (TPR) repeat protein
MKSFARNNQAYILLNHIGDMERAKSILEDAEALYPNKMIYANLGDIYRRKGEYDQALDCYAKARSLDPAYANGLNETAVVYLSKAAAEVNPERRAKLIATARIWHQRALSVVTKENKNQARQIRDTFEAALGAAPLRREKSKAAKSAASFDIRADMGPDRSHDS